MTSFNGQKHDRYIGLRHQKHRYNALNCGSLSLKCRHCDARSTSTSSVSSPTFGLCCGDGKVKLSTVSDPPEPLATRLTDVSTRCHQFRRDIRKCNCALCLASLCANEITFSGGPSVFKVKGEIYAWSWWTAAKMPADFFSSTPPCRHITVSSPLVPLISVYWPTCVTCLNHTVCTCALSWQLMSSWSLDCFLSQFTWSW